MSRNEWFEAVGLLLIVGAVASIVYGVTLVLPWLGWVLAGLFGLTAGSGLVILANRAAK